MYLKNMFNQFIKGKLDGHDSFYSNQPFPKRYCIEARYNAIENDKFEFTCNGEYKICVKHT